MKISEIDPAQLIGKYLECNNASETFRYFRLKNNGGNMKTLKSIFERVGVKYIPRPVKKYHFNENYFEKIDTEEKAYWLGFIAADGYVHNSGFLKIELATIDEKHLEKFRQAIGTSVPIRRREKKQLSGYTCRSSGLMVCSVKMIRDLNNLGIISNKSLVLKPCFIEDDLIIPYMRGYFDGDGSLCSKFISRPTASLASTKEMCDYFSIFLARFNIKTSWYRKKSNTKNTYKITVNGSFQTRKFMNLLYQNGKIFLDRKHSLYLEMLNRLKEIENSENHYISVENVSWKYIFYHKKKVFRCGCFKTKQDAFLACKKHMIDIGHCYGVEKLIYFNADCLVS